MTPLRTALAAASLAVLALPAMAQGRADYGGPDTRGSAVSDFAPRPEGRAAMLAGDGGLNRPENLPVAVIDGLDEECGLQMWIIVGPVVPGAPIRARCTN
ncbi:hypothetical protein HKCCE2091_21090 [Rhodobacterales bacterium HKCCE2091]|nr:hypothetical protein [Rhodobacterales bacterium HKCCE2091]